MHCSPEEAVRRIPHAWEWREIQARYRMRSEDRAKEQHQKSGPLTPDQQQRVAQAKARRASHPQSQS